MAKTKTFRNPIIPGFAPDPSVVFVDGVFYLATSSFHVFPGIPIYASTDLQEWKHIGNAINRKEQLSLERAETAVMPLDTGNIMVSSAGLFAPSIRHHEGRFYIICTNATRRDGEFCLENFYVSTADIWAGEWSDPIYFPFHGIDPSLFFDDDGRAYVQGCWMIDRLKQPSCTIKQFEIDIATGKALSEVKEIWGGFARWEGGREVKESIGARKDLPPSPKDVDLVYIRDPDFDKYKVIEEGEGRVFRLRASGSSISSPSGTATFVGKRQRAMDASASVRLDLSATKSGDPVVAGLALYKDALRHVSLAYDFGSSRLVFDVTTTSEDKKQNGFLAISSEAASLSFRVETSAKKYVFFYREDDDKDWKQAGSARVADLVAREMTGPIFGLFAHASGAEGVGKEARFDKFIVEGQKSLV
ncbi:hypothetical protein K4K59_008669, partial [Colletotrichum sp. SAR11_240]